MCIILFSTLYLLSCVYQPCVKNHVMVNPCLLPFDYNPVSATLCLLPYVNNTPYATLYILTFV